jgi:hypothetical protein
MHTFVLFLGYFLTVRYFSSYSIETGSSTIFNMLYIFFTSPDIYYYILSSAAFISAAVFDLKKLKIVTFGTAGALISTGVEGYLGAFFFPLFLTFFWVSSVPYSF